MRGDIRSVHPSISARHSGVSGNTSERINAPAIFHHTDHADDRGGREEDVVDRVPLLAEDPAQRKRNGCEAEEETAEMIKWNPDKIRLLSHSPKETPSLMNLDSTVSLECCESFPTREQHHTSAT